MYRALADYIAPKETGVKDYIGMFAVSTGFGQDELVAAYEKDHDDYAIIMLKSLTDRLAEAFAEKLHEDVRKTRWGYAKAEILEKKDLLKYFVDFLILFSVKYQGIRPAPGYPSQPDHTEKETMWKLMQPKEACGIELTESLAMNPASSVSGLYFASPSAEYFSIGEITKEQLDDYVSRKGFTIEQGEKWLGPNLSYK